MACFQPLRCPVLIGTMSSVTPTPSLPRTLQVFPGLWLLLSFPQWDYVRLLGEQRGGGVWFPADHIRNSSLDFFFYTNSVPSATLQSHQTQQRHQDGAPAGGTDQRDYSASVFDAAGSRLLPLTAALHCQWFWSCSSQLDCGTSRLWGVQTEQPVRRFFMSKCWRRPFRNMLCTRNE